MWQNGHDAYVESRVLSANGIELVRLLYQACTHAVREARSHLEKGEIVERSRSITRAWQILTELVRSLDLDRGGEIAPRLAALYEYMQRRLLEANAHQVDAPLAEVLGLLATLSEGWDGIRGSKEEPAASSPDSPWGQPQPLNEPPREHLWSL